MRCIVGILLLLGLAGCQKPSSSPPGVADSALRTFLNVHSLSGTYTLPEGDQFYQIALLEFEDGKLARKGMILQNGTAFTQTRTVEPQTLFEIGKSPPRILLSDRGTSAASTSDFWAKLDGGWSNSDPKFPVKQDGFIILAFAHSNLEVDGRVQQTGYGQFEEAVHAKKYVGAMAIRSAPTKEALK